MDSGTFTAGQAAARAGVTRKALRVYEAKGLIDEPLRTRAGYRIYRGEDIAVLTFIGQARTLGLSLDDISAILEVRRGGAAPCVTVRTFIDARIEKIDTVIADLNALRRALLRTRDIPCTVEQVAVAAPEVICEIVEHATALNGVVSSSR